MKMTFSHQLKKGFTLVELLVVIAIMAALAGVSYPIITSMIENSNITAANKVCKDIVSGVQGFKDDNGDLPINWDKVDENAQIIVLTTDGENDADFTHIMFNTEVGKEVANTNKPYIKADTVEDKMGGLYEEGETAGLYDPWGEPYYIFMLPDAEGSLTDPFTNTVLRNQWCIAYSTGTDRAGKHHDVDQPRAKTSKPNKKKSTKKDKKKDKDEEETPLRYPDYTEEEQESISDNVYSWKKTDD